MRNIIRIGDLKITEKEKRILNEILDSGMVTENENTRNFEKRWAEKIGTRYSIAVNSGTSALISGLYALKYLSGDEKRKKVITTPLSYIATSNSIKLSGLEPVYGDINRETFSLLPSEIEKILQEQDSKEFLAILPVHLMGYPCDMDKINKIAKKYNLFVFEDSAQAHGSKYKGRTLGSLGDLSDFSFYIAHNIQVGELGAVNTNNFEIRTLVKKIKNHGGICICNPCRKMEGKCPENGKYSKDEDFDPKFTHDIFGFNFKTTEFSTALALSKINEMDKINDKRRWNVAYLNEGLRKHDHVLQLPVYSDDVSYLGYPIIVKNGQRKEIRKGLEKRGIETRILFGCTPFYQPSFLYLKSEYEGKLPNAKYVGENGFYFGCHQYLTKKNLDHIIKSFDEILK